MVEEEVVVMVMMVVVRCSTVQVSVFEEFIMIAEGNSVAMMFLTSVSYGKNLISIARLSKILSPHENVRRRVLEFQLTSSCVRHCL